MMNGKRLRFGELMTRYPDILHRITEMRRQGKPYHEILTRLREEDGVVMSFDYITQYVRRFKLVQQAMDGFWTPERIGRYPDEFSRCIHAFSYTSGLRAIDPALADEVRHRILDQMRARVEAFERGESMPPLRARGRKWNMVHTQLRVLRRQRQLTRQELARRAKVQVDTITRWEHYGIVPRDIEIIQRVADALGVSIPLLIEDYMRYRQTSNNGQEME